MIPPSYAAWIEKYNREHEKVRGACTSATLEMLNAFPELTRVRGFVHTILYEKPAEHWWLVDAEKNIIDPTAKQFFGIMEYEEWDEEQEEPSGKCLNCGDYCYHGAATCSEACAHQFANSLRS